MGFNRSILPLAALTALASACATPPEEYPSLAIRDAERVSGTMEPVPAPPYIPPPPPAGVTDRLAQLTAQADTAHQAFSAQAPSVRSTVAAARGAEPGAESWARGHLALAGLEATRAPATTALADIDRLYVDAAVEGAGLEDIAAARSAVAAQVNEQEAEIAALSGALR
jgi:hypothetical protein